MYAKQDPATNMLFGYKAGEQTKRQFLLMLWNIYNFFTLNANADEWDNTNISESEHVLDRWITARLGGTLNVVTESLEVYDARSAALAIEGFVQDLSLWYVRRSRDRIGPNASNLKDKNSCYSTLYDVLLTLSKVLAPFMPFISEEIYKNLSGEESVHLASWPAMHEKSAEESKLIEQIELARIVVERGHAARKVAGIPVRQPLAKVKVIYSNEALQDDILQLIKEELNVRSVAWEVGDSSESEVTLDTNITPELEEEGKARELARLIQDERKKLGTPLSAKVTVIAPWVPKDHTVLEWLKKRTLSREISKGDTLCVEWES